MDIKYCLISNFVSYHIYGMQIEDESERDKLLPEIGESFIVFD